MAMTRLQEHYEKVVKPALVDEFKYGNKYQVPKLEKIVLNMGVGEAVKDSKKVSLCVNSLALTNVKTAGQTLSI